MKDRVMNCPNCGAPVTGGRCEYCGTLFLDFGALSMDEPTYMRIRTEEGFSLFRCIVTRAEFTLEHKFPEERLAWGEGPVIIQSTPEYKFTFEAVGVPNENGLVFIQSKKPTLDQQAQEMAGMEREL